MYGVKVDAAGIFNNINGAVISFQAELEMIRNLFCIICRRNDYRKQIVCQFI